MSGILCVGESLIDFIGEQAGKDIKEQPRFVKKAGGAPANVASVIGALGGIAYFYGKVGNDGFGDFLKANMDRFNVNTTGLIRQDQATTMAFVSLTEDGEREFAFAPGAGFELSFTDLPEDIYAASNCVHFGGAFTFLSEASIAAHQRFLQRCIRDNKFVCFDPNFRTAFWAGRERQFSELVQDFIEGAQLVKFSADEAKLISGYDNLEQAVAYFKEQYPATFAVTLGADGSRLFNAHCDLTIPAPKVEVVDATGAGDAFIASLLYNMAFDDGFTALDDIEKVKKWVTMANVVAANICKFKGAMGYFE